VREARKPINGLRTQELVEHERPYPLVQDPQLTGGRGDADLRQKSRRILAEQRRELAAADQRVRAPANRPVLGDRHRVGVVGGHGQYAVGNRRVRRHRRGNAP